MSRLCRHLIHIWSYIYKKIDKYNWRHTGMSVIKLFKSQTSKSLQRPSVGMMRTGEIYVSYHRSVNTRATEATLASSLKLKVGTPCNKSQCMLNEWLNKQSPSKSAKILSIFSNFVPYQCSGDFSIFMGAGFGPKNHMDSPAEDPPTSCHMTSFRTTKKLINLNIQCFSRPSRSYMYVYYCCFPSELLEENVTLCIIQEFLVIWPDISTLLPSWYELKYLFS